MELFEVIRRGKREEGLSVRALARRHRVHRRTVRVAITAALPPPRRAVEHAAPAIEPHRATIRRWLTEDLSAPPKQRHTARRIPQQLRTAGLVRQRGGGAGPIAAGHGRRRPAGTAGGRSASAGMAARCAAGRHTSRELRARPRVSAHDERQNDLSGDEAIRVHTRRPPAAAAGARRRATRASLERFQLAGSPVTFWSRRSSHARLRRDTDRCPGTRICATARETNPLERFFRRSRNDRDPSLKNQ